MPTTSRNLLIVFLLTVLVRILFFQLTGFTADHAFVTFRYADNLAGGNGFVYNLGRHVLGTSAPLYTLILASFGAIGMSAAKAGLFVSVIFSGLTAMVLYRFGQFLRFRWASWLPVISYALWPRSLPADISGMETGFFTLLVTSAFYFQHRNLEIYAIGMATLASLTRPEGLWLLAILLIYNWTRHPDRWFGYVVVPAILLIPWLLFSQVYFGSVVPNTIVARLALYSQIAGPSPWHALTHLAAWHTVYGWIVFVCALYGAWWLDRKQNFGRLEILWLLGMTALYTFAGTHIFFWYAAPIYPVYLLLASAAAPALVDRFHIMTAAIRTLSPVVYAVVTLALLAGCYKPIVDYREQEKVLLDVHRRIGVYLNAVASDSDLVAAEDIGYIGYYYGRQILDRDGLVSPEVIPYNRRGQYLAVITDFHPRWVVASASSPISGFTTDSLFLLKYAPDTTFTYGTVDYSVFLRRDSGSTGEEQSLDKAGS